MKDAKNTKRRDNNKKERPKAIVFAFKIAENAKNQINALFDDFESIIDRMNILVYVPKSILFGNDSRGYIPVGRIVDRSEDEIEVLVYGNFVDKIIVNSIIGATLIDVYEGKTVHTVIDKFILISPEEIEAINEEDDMASNEEE